MEFETVFKIGSCVSGTDMSGVFSVGSCVSHNEEYDELYIQPSRNWIMSKGYARNQNNRDLYFVGPTAESNWIIRNLFAVGSYPDKPTYLKSILDKGLDTFVCLNAEYGKKSHGIYYVKYAEKLPSSCTFIHEPIEDMETVKDEIIVNLALKIVELLRIGKKVYLLCAGGHGRAGTVASVVLHILCVDLSETELFDYIQYAHDQRHENYFGNHSFVYKMGNDQLAHHFCNGQVPSPQTSQQRDQVRRIMEHKYKI
jgi:protein-tyrosine phosphatase